MEEEDTIIEEFPVFLNKSLSNNLYVLQYPVKNKKYNFDKADVVNCCIKPVNQQIKIDYALNTASTHYDAFKGEQLAIAADGIKPNSKTEHPTFRSGRMDKQSYVSSIPLENASRYTVGVMQDKALHLVPVKTILQMRQNFSYFDKGDKRTKAEQQAENGSDDEADDLKQVTVKFARADNEKLRKAREKSYNFIQQLGADEPWCETMWYPKSSYESEMERQKITGYHPVNDDGYISLSSKEYFTELLNGVENKTPVPATSSTSPEAAVDEKMITQISTIAISMTRLKKLPLLDQVKTLLRDARVISFNSLMDLLGDSSIGTDKVLRNLSLCGTLIRGNWVLQSDYLYPTGCVSAINGVSAEYLCRARDYVLFKLTKHDNLSRQKISLITQLPQQEAKEVLESVAHLKPNKLWDLLKPPDLDFEKKHPELVQRQEVFFKAQEEKFNEMENEKIEKRIRKKSVKSS